MIKKGYRLFREAIKEFEFAISNQKPIVFDHLPKCGGSSINQFLSGAFPRKYIYAINGNQPHSSVNDFKKLPASKRHKIKLIYGHLANELFEYSHPNSIRATVLRDPVDRIVSHYYYVKRMKNHYLHQRVESENIQLADYCYNNLSGELENWYVNHFSGLDNQEIHKNPAKAVGLAYKNIVEKYHVVGFQDDIASFIKELKQVAKISVQFNNEVVNRTKNRISIKDLDQDTLEKISKKNSLDLELFGKLNSLKQIEDNTI